jgi:hypothetical protein
MATHPLQTAQAIEELPEQAVTGAYRFATAEGDQRLEAAGQFAGAVGGMVLFPELFDRPVLEEFDLRREGVSRCGARWAHPEKVDQSGKEWVRGAQAAGAAARAVE